MNKDENAWKTLSASASPESAISREIYHYCSLETFKAIIKNKTLRLLDITQSNDSEETRYIVNIIKKIP